jgi:hypothetical protein
VPGFCRPGLAVTAGLLLSDGASGGGSCGVRLPAGAAVAVIVTVTSDVDCDSTTIGQFVTVFVCVTTDVATDVDATAGIRSCLACWMTRPTNSAPKAVPTSVMRRSKKVMSHRTGRCFRASQRERFSGRSGRCLGEVSSSMSSKPSLFSMMIGCGRSWVCCGRDGAEGMFVCVGWRCVTVGCDKADAMVGGNNGEGGIQWRV